MAVCSMCDTERAVTVYGMPVCAECNDMLRSLQGELEDMEREDPVLRQLGENVEQSARRYIRERKNG